MTVTEAISGLREASLSQTWLAVVECPPGRSARDGGAPRQHLRLEAPASGCSALLARIDSVAAVFDGVVYNRADLSSSLGIRAETDADLILKLYSRWGEDALHKLRGVFALILWDGDRELLLCARDPMGMYPMFYAEARGKLMVSVSPETL